MKEGKLIPEFNSIAAWVEVYAFLWFLGPVRAIFVQPWNMVSVMAEKIKTSTLRFPAKENSNMEKALFD